MVNSLGLDAAELDALRELQAGMEQPDTADPIWDELMAIGLLEQHGDGPPVLTLLGRRYRTD